MTINLGKRAWTLPLDKNDHLEVARTYTIIKIDKTESVGKIRK